MTRRITVIAALLACATASSAVLAPFPHGKTTSYRYQTTVATTTSDEELINSSQFVMQGTLYVTHDNRDPELTNAYSVALSDVKTDMHNGDHVDYEGKPVVQPIDANANVIQKPFLIIYSADGIFEAVKIDAKEPEWSKNMKMAMASMLQLDLANIKAANEQRSFVSKEKTIHGDCMVNYNVYPKEGMHSNGPEQLRVNMTFSPMNCSRFAVHEFKNVDYPQCKREKEPRMFFDSVKTYELEKQDGGVIIKNLVADGNLNVVSSNGASYPHFVITKTTLALNQVQDKSDKELGNFADSPIIRDVTYRKPEERYSSDGAIDVTQGRHVVDLKKMPFQLEKLLIEALGYIEENHLDPKLLDWNRSQMMIEILHLMSYMNVDKLQASYAIFEEMVHPRAGTIKKMFLDVVSQVGTPAACIFIRDLITSNKVSTMTAVEMLTKLPLSVRAPTPELVVQLDDLISLDDSVSVEVKKAGILSVATLVHRTYKHLSQPKDKAGLDRCLQTLFNRVKEEPTYEMKIVYLMAMKNIQIGGIHKVLEPIIDGSLAISKKPEQLRLMAIWAIDKAVENNYDDAHRILWPVMVNDSLPTKLRIAAYEILLNQLPDENSAIKLHQYVNNQGNHHFYNYHVRTLDVIAKSVDPCKDELRTFAKNILKNIVWPPKSHENIHHTLSQVGSMGYAQNYYVDAEEIEYGMIVDELTGLPDVLRFKRVSIDDDGAVDELEIRIHGESLARIADTITGYYNRPKDEYSDVEKLLQKAAKALPPPKDFHIDIVLSRKGRVFMVNHHDFETIETLVDNLMMEHYHKFGNSFDFNYQSLLFDRMSEKQLTSDVGIPVMVTNRVPILHSWKIDFKNRHGSAPDLDLGVEFKSWKHEDSSMSVYNPMKDVWHSVRAKTAVEIQLPLRTTFSIDRSTSAARLSFPERDGTETAAVGLIMRGNHLVTVDEDTTEALKVSCPDCHHQQAVYHTDMDEEKTEEYTKSSFDVKDVGLEVSRFVHNSHYGYLSEANYGYIPTWDRSYKSNITDHWDDLFEQVLMAERQFWRAGELSTLMRSSGIIMKAEPSTKYPISHIEFKADGSFVDSDVNETDLVDLHAERFKFNGTFDVVSSRDKATVRLWDIDIDIDMDRNHLANEASVKITRKTPEEINFKICMNAKKNYPVPPKDDLKIGETKEQIDSKMTLTYGYTNEEKCSRNETLVKIVVKAELSDEQKSQWKSDMEKSPCSKDNKNPLYATGKNSVPRTMNCMDEAIRYTTLRRYIIDVVHEKLPFDTARILYRKWTDGLEPKENGILKFQADFSMDENAIDFQLMNANHSFTKKHILMNEMRSDGRGPVMRPLFDFPLDNTRFPIERLIHYTEDDIRICSVYPKTVMTADGDNVAFNIPSDQWTLITGDHVDNKFAIFANQPRPNYLSFVVLIRNHAVRFYTRDSDNVLVAEAPGDVEPTDKGFRLPTDENFGTKLKVMKHNDNFVVRSRQLPLELLVGANYITVTYTSNFAFQGYVSGLCGHLNGTSIHGNPETFSMTEIPESL